MKNNQSSKVIKEKPVEWTNWGRFKLFIVFIIIFGAFIFFVRFWREVKKDEIKFIESDYGFIKAKIVDKSTYKSWTLTVEYVVNNKKYVESEAVINNSLNVGDSIWIKYSKLNPKLIIIDLTNE